jgi:hypothetical protein
MLESKQVVLPPLDKLIKQLSEMQQKKREGSDYIKIQHPDKDGHDDYATAFVLSLWATRTSDVPVIFTKSKRGFFGD